MKIPLFVMGILLTSNFAVRGDVGDKVAKPVPGFDAEHYLSLWTASPFALATAESTGGSADFALVGVAEIGGISYASLVGKGTQEHFVLSSGSPVRGLTLVQVSHDSSGPAVTIRRSTGDLMTLRPEKVSPSAAEPPPALAATDATQPAPENSTAPPSVRLHHHVVVVPSPPSK